MAKLSKQRAFKVFPAEGGFSALTRASLEVGTQHELQGVWRREYDPTTGEHIGFRIVGEEARRVDSDLRSMRSTAAISANEMQLNVQRSRTYGLREEDRLARIKRGQMPEDRVERVKAKTSVYAVITHAKGDILRVWPK
jgi:hypothetical protein